MRRLLTFVMMAFLFAVVILATSPSLNTKHQIAYAVAGTLGTSGPPVARCPADAGPAITPWAVVGNGSHIQFSLPTLTGTTAQPLSLLNCDAGDPFTVTPIWEGGPDSIGVTWSFAAYDDYTGGVLSNPLTAPYTLPSGQEIFLTATCTASATTEPGVYTNFLVGQSTAIAPVIHPRFQVDCKVAGPGLSVQTYDANGTAPTGTEIRGSSTSTITYDVNAINTSDDVAVTNRNVLQIDNTNVEDPAVALLVDVNWSGALQLNGAAAPTVPDAVLSLNINGSASVNDFPILPADPSLIVQATCNPLLDTTWVPGTSPARIYSRTFAVVHNYPEGGVTDSFPTLYRVTCTAQPTPNISALDSGAAVPNPLGATLNVNITGVEEGRWGTSSPDDVRILNTGHQTLTVNFAALPANLSNIIRVVEVPPAPDAASPPAVTGPWNVEPGSGTGRSVYIACRPTDDTTIINATITTTVTVNVPPSTTPTSMPGPNIAVTCTPVVQTSQISARHVEQGLLLLDTTPPTVDTVNLGSSAVNGAAGTPVTIRLRNNGSTGTAISIVEDPGPSSDELDFNLITTNTNFFLDPNEETDFSVACQPQQAGARQLLININGPTPDQLRFICTGTSSGGGTSSFSLNSTATTLTAATPFTTVTVTNTGNQTVNLNSIQFTGANAGIFSVLNTSNQPLNFGGFNLPSTPGSNTYTFNVSCLDTTGPAGKTATLVVGSVNAGTQSRTFTCNNTSVNPPQITSTPNPNATNTPQSGATNTPQVAATNTPQGGVASYNSTPANGQTIAITANLNEEKTSDVVISAGGTTGSLTIQTVSLASTGSTNIKVKSQSGNPTLTAGTSGSTYTITISCLSSASGTFSSTLTVVFSGGTASYPITCTVGSVTATPGAGTAQATVASTALTQCPNNLVLSSPLPQNASGEFLLVNCFQVTGPGSVSVPLTQVLTGVSSSTSATDQESIRTNPAQLSFWRMGSWFLVPSEYNPATQTFTFTAASGQNTYGVFFGAITRTVGSQANASFAGTTTGNAEDLEDVTLDSNNPTIFVGIIATLFVLFVGAIYFTRRQQNAKALPE
jgi:hypothetical protein